MSEVTFPQGGVRGAVPLRLHGIGGRWTPPALIALTVALIFMLQRFGGGLSLPALVLLWALIGLSAASQIAAFARWLHATGRSGLWAVIALLPGFGAPLLLLSLFLRRRETEAARFAPAARYRVGALLLLLLVALFASRAFWSLNTIAAGSMLPTLHPGDQVLAVRSGMPERGDVVVFRPPSRPLDYVSRIVAMAGERVQMRSGILHIDGMPAVLAPLPPHEEPKHARGPAASVPRCTNAPVAEGEACLKTRLRETLPGGRAHDILDLGVTPLDDGPEIVVPPGHVFLLSDNRDNAWDSRTAPAAGGYGPIPIEALRGTVQRVLLRDGGLSEIGRAIE